MQLLTGLSVLCSLNVSSSTMACSFESLSFFLEVSPPAPSSSSLPREHEVLSASMSSPFSSLSLRFPLILDIVLFGDETPFSSSQFTTVDGAKFTSIPRRNDLVSELGSATYEYCMWVRRFITKRARQMAVA